MISDSRKGTFDMKKIHLKTYLIFLFFFLLVGCTDKSDKDEENSPIGEPFNEQQGNGGVDIDDSSNSGAIVDGSDKKDEMFQKPYAVISSEKISKLTYYVEKGELKEIKFKRVNERIGSHGTEFTLDFELAICNGEIQLGASYDCFEKCQIPNCEDKILLKSELDDILPFYRVLDITTNEVLKIYPNEIEEEYYIRSIFVSPDLSEVIMLTSCGALYYDGNKIEKIIPEYDEKFINLRQAKVLSTNGKMLVTGFDSDYANLCCYIFDWSSDEVVERIYPSEFGGNDGLKEYGWTGEIRYGTYMKNGYLTIVDFLTGREDITEIPEEKIRYVETISEDWFVVLADYGYIIEKATGRTIGRTEYIIQMGAEDKIFNVGLLPSDKDIYFWVMMYGSEESNVYKINLSQ